MSELGNRTTTDEVLAGVDLTGRRVLITGGAVGLGRESARALAAHGAEVTILARSAERAAEGVAAVSAAVPDAGPRLHAGEVDLGDLASIRAFADGWLAAHDVFDVLVNNAGVMACPFRSHRRRVRDPVRHQPPRPLPAHRAAGAGAVAG